MNDFNAQERRAGVFSLQGMQEQRRVRLAAFAFALGAFAFALSRMATLPR